MLEVSRLRADREGALKGLKKRFLSEQELSLVDEVIRLDDLRKSTQTTLDGLLAQRKTLSSEIGQLFKNGETALANQRKEEVNALKIDIEQLEATMQGCILEMEEVLLQLPNIPHPSVPQGKTEDDNEVVDSWTKTLPELPDDALPHWELAEKYQLFDLKLGVKITGAGFPLYRGQGARLQRSLINFFIDQAIEAGYEEIIPPLLVNEDTARGTGQLPDKEGQMYYVEKDNLYLLPTAEVPVTNIVRDVILKESDMPIKFCGHTPCFRREAGSYGADVKGLNRVHQFDKIEIVQVTHPDHSYDVLNEMVDHVSNLLQKLELPYRILRLCSGDLGFTSALTFDFEVYSAAQKRWLEVSSVSNFETFQANRLKCRFKDDKGKSQLAHTLNGSALALARVVAAILENNQTADGIKIPEVLQPYTGFDMIK